MKKILFAALIAASFNAAADNAGTLRYVVGAGLTIGGDKLATATYTNGDSVNIKAGSGLQVLGGVDYRVTEQVSLQATLGYHVHFTPSASNGDASFTRIPVELLAYYHLNNQWRVGGGVRYVASPELNGKGAASNIDMDFKNTTGAVLEAEYFVNNNFGVKLRAVSEKYEPKSGKYTGKASGNHVGIFGNYYF
ncbi:outer membrane beta-barrel protein [Massilia sp. YIM B04103]|uniref:outer membrane beta-barrel protein n=1 Tax=Massilia sp. YIM B04103 TaxID=2963106 RepID=UPI00210BCF8F|nr:outer membrane beta-barrel protein [Massilia sp. YIM B04103]